MKNNHTCFGRLLWSLLLVTLVGLTGCESDDADSGSLQLFYPEVSNIGPSMNFISGAPSYHGGATPHQFAISRIKLDGEAIQSESFTINAGTGAVTISNTENLTPGLYSLSISCLSGNVPCHFADIFVVRMLPAAPESLEVSVTELEIPYAEVKTSEATIEVTPVGESVSIISWALQQEEGKEYFSISKEGVISVNSSYKGDILPGVYPLTLTLSTHAASNTYENIVCIKVTSEPLELTYTPAAGRMEYNMAFESAAPALKGSPEEVTYTLKSVSPESDKFQLDPQSGVISVEAGSELPVEGHYVLDITVSNRYGSVDFAEAFTLDVIDYIAPIEAEHFAYAEAEMIQGTFFTAEKLEGFVGDEATFSLGELPAELEGQLAIDAVTGSVSASRGNTIPVGTYAVPVVARNTKNEVQTTLSLRVIENPYYFTTISYGNNLGLTGAGYANQYRCATKKEYTGLELIPMTDAKEGVALEWKVVIKHQCKGTSIDEATGQLTLSGDGYKANNGGLVLVTATAGKGTVGETSVTVPVFFSFIQEVSGVTVHYTPFVFQCNPRKGGSSVVPTTEGATDMSMFLIDYRRTFNYYNFNGPASHVDGQPSVAGSFMNMVWTAYYTGKGSATVNTGSKDPLSYYSNASNLSQALCYVDSSDKHLVVNPNKWVDEEGNAANGAFIGQMTFVTDGNESKVNSGSQIFPIWIWFDEKF